MRISIPTVWTKSKAEGIPSEIGFELITFHELKRSQKEKLEMAEVKLVGVNSNSQNSREAKRRAREKAEAGGRLVFFTFLFILLTPVFAYFIVVSFQDLYSSSDQVKVICNLVSYDNSTTPPFSVYSYPTPEGTVKFVDFSPALSAGHEVLPQTTRTCWYSINNPKDHSFTENTPNTKGDLAAIVIGLFLIVLVSGLLVWTTCSFREKRRLAQRT